MDGDIIAYRASVAAQEDIDWGDGNDGLTVDEDAAVENALKMTRSWLELSRCDRAILCMSPDDGANFRHQLGGYKEGRGEKPVAYWNVVNALADDYKIMSIAGLEGDDVMGILATSDRFRKRSVIVSIDKDMNTIPGKLLSPLKDKKPRRVRPIDADRYWMTQTLTGDRVDGYKGCPGIGPVKADKLLGECGRLHEMWKAVLGAYIDKGLSEDDALLQARFARILRREDYDKENERIKLWHPTTPEWVSLTSTSRAD